MSLLRSLAAAVVLVAPVLAQGRPPIFQELDFEAALARSKSESRVFVLDAMTSWCGPCKQMDATTWREARVTKWLTDKGLAVQLDMDEHEALKTRLGVRAFPTIIAFKDGVEFDRIVGSRGADEFLEWLEDVGSGATARQRLQRRLDKARTAGDAGWDERYAITDELSYYGEHALVLEECSWLWSHASPDKRPRLVGTMLQLVREHPPAVETFRGFRAALDARLAGGGSSPDERDAWIDLNTVLGDERLTADWADGSVADEAGLGQLRARERRLFDLLVAQGRWRTAGLILGDPVAEVRWYGSQLGAYDHGPAQPAADGSVPMIPMGGAPRDAAGPVGEEPKSMPAIPLGGPQGGQRQGEAAGEPAKAIPAIPLTGPKGEGSAGAAPGGMVPAVPIGGPRRAQEQEPKTPESIAREVRERLTWQFRRMAGDRYGALLAAGREKDAEAVAATTLKYSSDARAKAALVGRALRAGAFDAARARHQQWLDEAAD